MKIHKSILLYIILFAILMGAACNFNEQISADSATKQPSPTKILPTEGSIPTNPLNTTFPIQPPIITLENATEIVEVANWRSSVSTMAFSPDGSILVTESLGKLYLWRVRDQTLLHTIDFARMFASSPARAFAFSPDGKLLAVDSGDETGIVLWNTQDWSQITLKQPHRYSSLFSIAFSPDSRFLVTSGILYVGYSTKMATEMWSANDGTTITTIAPIMGVYRGLSPDAKTIALGTDSHVLLYSTSDGQEISGFTSAGNINAIAFSPDGQTIAVSTANSIEFWQVSDGTKISTLPNSSGEYTTLMFLGSGRLAAVAWRYSSYRVWQLSDGTLLSHASGYGPAQGDDNFRFTLDGEVVAWDGRLRRITDDKIINDLVDTSDKTLDIVAFSSDRRWFAYYTFGNGAISVWAVRSTSASLAMETTVPTPTPKLTATPAPPPSLGSTMKREKDGMVMVYVPAGAFKMGSNQGLADQKPVHKVTLDAYWIDQTEVTNGMYALCVSTGWCQLPHETDWHGKKYFDDPNKIEYPVIYVDWQQANTYCQWVSGRLPTEAEWEKAARGTDGRTNPWGNTIDETTFGNFSDEGGRPERVGSYEKGKSPYGAYDMAGNVLEWTADWYDVYPGGNPKDSEYFGVTNRVLRGGAWDTYIDFIYAARRLWSPPDYYDNSIGFRCVFDATQ